MDEDLTMALNELYEGRCGKPIELTYKLIYQIARKGELGGKDAAREACTIITNALISVVSG